jgi:hypothetical protein
VTVTVDRHAVTAFATVTLAEKLRGCTETAATITCNLKGADIFDYVLDLTVKAKDTAEVGAKGDLILSLAVKGGSTVSTRSTVEIGEGVDLQAQEALNASGAPGATVKTPSGSPTSVTRPRTVRCCSSSPCPGSPRRSATATAPRWKSSAPC